MNAKIIIAMVLATVMGVLTGCTLNSDGPAPGYVDYTPGYYGYKVGYDGTANPDIGYGPNADDTDFNHDSAVGYGGVNVYDYNQS